MLEEILNPNTLTALPGFNMGNVSVLMLIVIILVFSILAIGLPVLFKVESYNTYKKRQKTLQKHRNKKKKQDDDEVIQALTKPIITHLFSKLKPKDLKQIDKKLKLVGWDKDYTAEQFKAIQVIARIGGVLVVLVFASIGEAAIGMLIGAFAFILPGMALNGEVEKVKTSLLSEFPDFVRIVQGYLTIDQPFVLCVENSLKFVGPAWRNILEEFIVLCNTRSVEDALSWMKDEVDIFEVKEFVSMVRLSLEQGGDVRKSFDEQADKVKEILQDLIRIKIEKRRIMGIAVQAPLLICCFVVFGLPVFAEFMNLSL